MFKKKVAELNKEGEEIIFSREDKLGDGEITFIFNCAVFDLVKEHRKNVGLIVESPIGRGGYSDLTITSPDEDLDYIEIEHENSPENDKGKQLENCIKKLSKSKAKTKLLITYYYGKFSVNVLKQSIQKHVNKYFKEEKLYVLYGPWEGEMKYRKKIFEPSEN